MTNFTFMQQMQHGHKIITNIFVFQISLNMYLQEAECCIALVNVWFRHFFIRNSLCLNSRLMPIEQNIDNMLVHHPARVIDHQEQLIITHFSIQTTVKYIY